MARHRDLLRGPWLAWIPPALFYLLLLSLPWAIGIAESGTRKAHELAMLAEGRALLDGAYLAWVGLAGLGLLGLALWRGPALWQRLVLAGLIQVLVVFGVLVPRVMEVMQAPVKEAALLARRLDRTTVVFRTSMPSFSVYRDAITPDRIPRPGELVFLRVDKLGLLARELPDLEQQLVYRRGPVALVLVGERVRPTFGIEPRDGDAPSKPPTPARPR
jgi:hypothetical protein